MYKYNDKAFRRKTEKRELSQREISRVAGSSLPTVGKWVNGEDISVNKLLAICNHFRVPLGDFIEENGLPVSSVFTDGQNNPYSSDFEQKENAIAETMKYEKQMKELKEMHQTALHALEREYLNRIADIREASAEKWAKKLADAVNDERRRADKNLREKDEEIIRLKAELIALRQKNKPVQYQTEFLSESDGHKPNT